MTVARLRPRSRLAAVGRPSGSRRRPRVARVARARARATAGTSSSSARPSSSAGIRTACSSPGSSSRSRPSPRSSSSSRWIARRLEGYPLPQQLAEVVAVSAACGARDRPGPLAALRRGPRVLGARERARGAGRRAAPGPRARARPRSIRSSPRPLPLSSGSTLGWPPTSPSARASSAICRYAQADLCRRSRTARGRGRSGRPLPADARSAASAWGCAPAVSSLALAVAWRQLAGRLASAARRVCASRSSTSARATRSSSRCRRAPSSSTRARRRPTSPTSSTSSASTSLAVARPHPSRSATTSAGPRTCSTSTEVEAVLDPGHPGREPRRARGAPRPRATRRAGVPRPGRRGFSLGRLRIRVLWPDGGRSAGDDRTSTPSCSLASYGGIDVLLTADAEGERHGAAPTAARGDPQGRPPRLGGHGPAGAARARAPRDRRRLGRRGTTTTATRRRRPWPRSKASRARRLPHGRGRARHRSRPTANGSRSSDGAR